MKSITFLLPGMGGKPSGGGKVVSEYANRFSRDGYLVTIIYPASLLFGERSFYEKSKSIARYLYYFITRKYKSRRWFSLDSNIKERLVWSLSEKWCTKSDFVIATAMETSEYLNKYKKIPNDRKIYFIQGYESWNFGEERFLRSLKFNLRKITIASHLKKAIEDLGEKVTLIENGFDFDYFHITTPIEKKNKLNISMLYHKSPLKGLEYGLEALKIVHTKLPELTATLFGACPPPKKLPNWITYHQSPCRDDHNRIYNDSAIFLGPSLSEGWGLTIGEAMICGSSVVCTQIDGYKEMAIDNATALTSPIKDSEDLALNIIKLIKDDQLRYKIANNGNKNIKQYTWERAYTKFKNEIEITNR